MATGPAIKSTPQLIGDLLLQSRELVAAEVALMRAELGESAKVASAAAARVLAGAALLYAGLIILLVAIAYFLVRLGAPEDVAFFIVALVTLGIGAFQLRSASQALRASKLLPSRSLAQMTSLLKGL